MELNVWFGSYASRKPQGPQSRVSPEMAVSRHLVKTGAPDLVRAAPTPLNDFRSGALGSVRLETVEG